MPLDTALSRVNRKLARQKKLAEALTNGDATSSEEVEEEEPDIFLKYNPAKGFEEDKYAVLTNDWPYNVPYGVRHFCVWSRVGPDREMKLLTLDSNCASCTCGLR